MHLLVEFHKNYNSFLPGHPPTMLVIHKVPLEVIPRYPPKGLSTGLQGASVIPKQSRPTVLTRSSAFIILLVPRGIVVGVVGVVYIVINFQQ